MQTPKKSQKVWNCISLFISQLITEVIITFFIYSVLNDAKVKINFTIVL